MKKKKLFFYYLNPRNVSAAIANYGYAYSVKNSILLDLAVAAVAASGGVFLKLDPAQAVIVAAGAVLMASGAVINSYKNMYEQKRFSDVNLYMEQILYSFKKMPKVLTALQDAEKIMPQGSPMRDTIGEAIRYIRMAHESENALEDGLKQIEQKYRCQRIRDVHALMLKTEKIGGNYASSVKILLSSRAVWETETCKFQRECKNRQHMVNIALVLVCGVCLLTPLLLAKFAPMVNIMDSQVYKVGTVIMILISMKTYSKADGMASINWLRNESALTPEAQESLYRRVVEYDGRKEAKKSCFLALGAAGIGILFFLLKWTIPAVCCIPVFFLMQRQHTVGHALAKKSCRKEIEKAFPQWLMEISLLLQVSDNVNAAVANSIVEAPAILKEGLRKMQAQIMENPESNEPYMNFMREFEILEIQSAMGMLYSISSGRGGDADAQINEILSKNTALLGQSERAANESRLAALYWQFLLPSLIGGGKLLVDMTLVTMAFMSMDFY